MLDRHPPSSSPQPPPPPAPASSRSGKRKRGASPARKRGGQPGNQNARKLGTYSRYNPGPLSHILDGVKQLHQDISAGLLSPQSANQKVAELRGRLVSVPQEPEDFLAWVRLQISLSRAVHRAILPFLSLKVNQNALEDIARDPFDYFRRWYRRAGISRDADSFFIVSEKYAQISPLPPRHPRLATNLTAEQWALLAPLVPPDPNLDYLCGLPPVIIAANRWKFTRYTPTGEMADSLILKEYRETLEQRAPALLAPPRKRPRPRKRKYSPRALLDAILWKLATGHTWDELPAGFPPYRACQKYYRRLFLSGRFYTMLLALYNHMRLEMCVDPWTLCEAGLFTTTPNQRIALVPEAAPTSGNYTALLFMQLARTACAALQRDYKEKQPLYILMPVFKGESRLSTARLPGVDPQLEEPAFQPLEGCLAWKKHSAAARERKTIDRKVAGLVRLLAGARLENALPRPAAPPPAEPEFIPLEESLGWRKARIESLPKDSIDRETCPRSRSPDPAQRPSLEDALSSLLASAAPDSAEALLAALVEFLEGLED